MKPRIIHQIAITDSGELPDLTGKTSGLTEFFSDYKHIVWSDTTIKELMVENRDFKALNAYNALKPYSFKADFARFYIVHNFGGWYIDLNQSVVDYPPSLDEYDFIVCADIPALTSCFWPAATSFFYADKGHYILRRCIEQIIKNVDDEYYGAQALCPTGPNLFGSVIASFNLPEDAKYCFGNLVQSDGYKTFMWDNREVCLYKKNGLIAGNPGITGGNSYVDMYLARDVYDTAPISKIVLQTSKVIPEQYVIDKIVSLSPGYSYVHFDDEQAIQYFLDNPLDEFPNIVDKFNSFTNGAHKADLFRYYFLYLNGGVYIDTDLMIEKDLPSILGNFPFVSLLSKFPHGSVSNSFVASSAKHPVIYAALKYAYSVDQDSLDSDYHHLVRNLFHIIYKDGDRPDDVLLYDEELYEGFGATIHDSAGERIMCHYNTHKVIPR